MKIKPDAFKELNNDCVNHFYSSYPIKRWNGFRLIAFDGSEVLLPKTQESINEFGEYTTNFMNKTIVLSRISKAYDVLNKITIDAKLVNRKIGEHYLANQHLEHCGKGDLILLDRGYPSFDLFRNTLASGCHFCARLAISNWNIAKKLVESGKDQIIAEIHPGHELYSKYKRNGIKFTPIQLRFIRVELSSGEKEVLVTSLLDTERYPYHLFKELYHMRWFVEESYKIDKHRLQLENFSGKTIIAIYQDFYAKLLLANITAILSNGLDKEINRESKKAKYRYQINITTALAKVKETIALLFTRSNIIEIINGLIQMFLENLSPIKPGRSFARNKQKRKRYHKCYLAL